MRKGIGHAALAGLITVTGLAATGVAGAQVGSGPKARASQSPAALTIAPTRVDLVLGNLVRINGRLSSVTPLGGHRVELVADPFPYGDPAAVASTTTAGDGRYSFLRRPGRNTVYRVQAAGATSRLRTIYVAPRNGLGIYQRGARVELRAVVTGTPPITPGGTTLYWYVRVQGSSIFRRIATSRLAPITSRSLRSVIVVRDPRRPGQAARFVYCARRPFLIGQGRPIAATRCGAPTARVI